MMPPNETWPDFTASRRRERAMVAACEGLSTEALEGLNVKALVEAAQGIIKRHDEHAHRANFPLGCGCDDCKPLRDALPKEKP